MKVAAIALDAASRLPIVILRDLHDRRALPIWIGKAEANAILQALEGQKSPRPMTHDLMAGLCKEWDLHVEKIVIHSLQNNTFYAIITTRRGKLRKEIDSRPSDAIALALRTATPIWAMEEVIAEASIPVDQEADEAEREAFRDFLDTLNPNDFISNK
nr:bifunctional nuclease family protein [Gloeobacter kilaueensis]